MIHAHWIERGAHLLVENVHDIDARVRGVRFGITAAVAWSVAGPCRIRTGGCAAPSIRGAGIGQFRRGHGPRVGSSVACGLGWHGDGKGLAGTSMAGGMARHMSSHVDRSGSSSSRVCK